MATKTEIGNQSLLRIGAQQFLTDLDTDANRDALAIRAVYDQERLKALRDVNWPFARKYSGALTLVYGSISSFANPDWIFAYRWPVDCIFVRRIVNCFGRKDCNPPEFVIGRDEAIADAAAWNVATAYTINNVVKYLGKFYKALGSTTGNIPLTSTANWVQVDPRLIFTNQTSAACEYTANITEAGEFDPDFASMFAWRIADQLSLGVRANPEIRKLCREAYAEEKAEAISRAFAEGEYAIPSGQADPMIREIFNQAITRIGVSRNLVSVDPELTFANLWPRVCFADERDYVLRDFPWPFATGYATLELIGGTDLVPVNGDWLFAYRLPTDNLYIRRLVTALGRKEVNHDPFTSMWDYLYTNDTDITMTLSTAAGWTTADTITVTASDDFFIETEPGNVIRVTSGADTVDITVVTYTSAKVVSGTPSATVAVALRSTALETWSRIYIGQVLLTSTSMEDVEIEYTRQITDPARFDPMFKSLMAWRLGALLAPSISKTKNDANIPARALQLYEYEKSAAQRAALNEGQGEVAPDAEWITGR